MVVSNWMVPNLFLKNGWKSPFPSIKKKNGCFLRVPNSLKFCNLSLTKQAFFCLVADILDPSFGCRKLGWQPPIRGYVVNKRTVRQNKPGWPETQAVFSHPNSKSFTYIISENEQAWLPQSRFLWSSIFHYKKERSSGSSPVDFGQDTCWMTVDLIPFTRLEVGWKHWKQPAK